MDFSEIENLKQEDILELYDDIMEFGDDTRLSDCCCTHGNVFGYDTRNACKQWCRSRGWACIGWEHSWLDDAPAWDCNFSC